MTESRKVPFVLMGAGGVGAELLKAIVSARTLHETRYGVRLEAVAVCDSSGSVGADSGLSDEEITAIVSHKAAGGKLVDMPACGKESKVISADGESAATFLQGVARQCGAASPGCIVVDCTATGDTVPALLEAARAVSANKKPFADAPMESFDRLVLRPGGPARVRYESTVAAGVPVIAAVQRVVGSADAVTLISGSFSGTLGYVMSGLQAGLPTSPHISPHLP